MAYERILRSFFADQHTPQVVSFASNNPAFASVDLIDVVDFCIRMGWADTAYVYARLLARG